MHIVVPEGLWPPGRTCYAWRMHNISVMMSHPVKVSWCHTLACPEYMVHMHADLLAMQHS